ncbi:hypothetical protein [Eubacterium maltosivorans]|uniref:hypothetical protein n=1 Tax=Eubacterium maltosivorans TaxID=2041044 RepID=UPI00189EE1F5|nr:hypothetical protein [Eubacterium maltosivorans]
MGVIILNKEWRITSDSRNVTIEKNTEKGNWIPKYHLRSLGAALQTYRKKCHRSIIDGSGEMTLGEAIEKLTEFDKAFINQINGLKVRELNKNLKGE